MRFFNIFSRTIKEHRQLVGHLSPLASPVDVPCVDFEKFQVYTPTNEKPLPTLIYIPGNAFIASETRYTHYICSQIAKKSRCQVIVIKHKLAPEYQFPLGLEDAAKILLTLLSAHMIKKLNIDTNRLAIAGYSSGGNLAALMTIQAKKFNIPFARQILISPITDLSRSLKGFEYYERKDTAISEQFVSWFLDLYVPTKIKTTDPKLSPHWVDNIHLKNLPPTDIIFGEYDRFRGDAETYGKKLTQQGNKTCLFMFPKENHGLLWHNTTIISTIAARLSLSFNTEIIERPISKPEDYEDLVSVFYLKTSQQTCEKYKPNQKQKKVTPLR